MHVLSISHTPSSVRPVIVPVVPDRGMIDPTVDRMLSNLARRDDRSDPEVRNALYVAYAPRLRRILLRLWYRNLQDFGCELCDLEQELFLVFAALLDRWSGNGSLSAYLHGALPWRLYDAARRLAPHDRSLANRVIAALDSDSSYADAEAAMLLEELANRLSSFDCDLLLWYIRDGKSLGQFARSRGMSHHTVRRAWLRLQQHLRRLLA